MTPQSERQLIACMRRVASVVWLSCGLVGQLTPREHGRERVIAELSEPHRIVVRSVPKTTSCGKSSRGWSKLVFSTDKFTVP